MKVIELSEFRSEEGEISLEDRIRGTLRHGLRWYGEMQAQEAVSQRLNRNLGPEHVLIRNLPLPRTDVAIPLILISPQGVRVLMPSAARGVFRAKGDEWQTFDGRARRFKRVRPNLQTQVSSMARAVQRYLENQGYPLPDIEAVLLFTNPRTHVDTARPSTRVVLADAFDHFAANLQELQIIMGPEDIAKLVKALTSPEEAKREPTPETTTAAPPGAVEDEGEFFNAEPLRDLEQRPLARGGLQSLRAMGLNRQQWIVLGVMAFFELVILIAFALMILGDLIYG